MSVMKREPGLLLYRGSLVVGCTNEEDADPEFNCCSEFQLVPPVPVMFRLSSDFLVVFGKFCL